MPETTPPPPSYDETKLRKTQFARLYQLWAEAREKAREAQEAADSYKAEMAELQLKHGLDTVTVDGSVCRWIPPGEPGKKFSPQLALKAGLTPNIIERCMEPTKPRAAYYQIYLPRGGEEE